MGGKVVKAFEFLFDVGGPNGYLAHKVLPDFCTAHGTAVHYRPVLLGGLFKATGNRQPMMRYADAPAKLNYEMLEFRRFIAKHGLTQFQMNPHFPVNSLLAMRVITAVDDKDEFMTVVDALMAGMWEQGLDLSQRDVLATALGAAGLDGEALVAMADDEAVKAKLVANTDAAVARGVFGIPTFFVGDEMFWGKERLGQVAEALALA
jgi:2-hydroxychromene-2-carboxylate isomerase